MRHEAPDNDTVSGPNGAPDNAFPALDGVRHRFLDLPGLRMHVAEAGHGEPVVLLHGFPQHWWEWRGVIQGLAARYRVICPDLRGAGWTDAPPTGYTRDQLLADVVALLDALELDRVCLVAHDWGALLGYELCLSAPDRVRKYVSLAVPHPFVRFDPRLLLAIARHGWFEPVIAAPVLGPRLLGRGRQRLAHHLLRDVTTDRNTWSDEDVELFVGRLREPARADAASALYRRFIMPEAARILTGAYGRSRLRTPTRALVGAEDPIVRPEFLGGFVEHTDDFGIEFVDGASHFVVDERPDAVLEHVLEFFASS
ncbi:MAG: alpha/beta hydrolase [Rhodococcus sp. (in: high G+C Gram-positive bacteria)]|nr:MAG: alpha/beta hydrolase [Rhodococcus sp. (in: high G+C Gram-positive bacteria)]